YKYTFNTKRIEPYIELGIGMFRIRKSVVQYRTESESNMNDDLEEFFKTGGDYDENKFGFSIGGGITLKKSGSLKLLLDMNYMAGFIRDNTIQFLSYGFKIKF
ncbi:hypothetical protein ACFL6G_08165, partial [candidate division KSB1 bacterium]